MNVYGLRLRALFFSSRGRRATLLWVMRSISRVFWFFDLKETNLLKSAWRFGSLRVSIISLHLPSIETNPSFFVLRSIKNQYSGRSSKDSDMVEIAPPTFVLGSTTLEIQKGWIFVSFYVVYVPIFVDSLNKKIQSRTWAVSYKSYQLQWLCSRNSALTM